MVDPANTEIGRMLLDEISPVVMVLSTPLAEEACLKNGLSLVEMLAPFCKFNNIDVPVRTSSDQPYRIRRFKLRLFYASDIRKTDLEAATSRLKRVISDAGEKDFPEQTSDPPQISDILKCAESEILPTWFQYYNKELINTLSFAEHEAYDHPVACLLVVSSKDEDPINKLVDMLHASKLPSLLKDGAADPKILKNYLLVHDNQDGMLEKATRILAEMRSSFGTYDSQLLRINSCKDEQRHSDNPWGPFKPDALPSQCLGCCLNLEDIHEIKVLMQELSSKRIIPYMEQKVRALNQQVSATRKGFKNQIKNLWWRKGKEDASDFSNIPMYTYRSTESQIRILGDYAFMLHDYELALSSYRLISTDFKIDKAWKHYAGVQEMIGLTYFISDQSKKEVENCMENAFNCYIKMGSIGLPNATRCGLWWVEMLKARDQYKDAAAVYFRICGEEPLHAAVMLEQASYCYLLSKPPMLHKYGFHLVLSGDHYKKCDQVKHAIRTYRNAISIYKGTPWSHIKDHVYFHIGQWYAFVGMYDIAVTCMLEVLACSYQSKATQERFLKDFLQVVQKTGKQVEVLKLQLPVINMSSLKVICEDQRTYATPAAASVKESFWHSFEEDIVPSFNTAKFNWLELQSKLLPKKYKESNICVAGEAIRVDIEFRNPLQISISASSVSLICELSARSDEMPSDPSSSSTELQDAAESKLLTSSRETSIDFSSFALSEVDFSIGGGETTLVQLTVTPNIEGNLKIVGVRWKLSGSVVGVHYFEPDPLKKRTFRERGKVKVSPGNDLKFIVIKSLPRLEGVLHPFPEKVYAGDLRHLVLDLKNHSESPVKNLKMKISDQRFLSIGNQEQLTVKFPDCLEKGMNVDHSSSQITFNKRSNNVFIFPEDVSIQMGTPLLWPLWLRAAVPGNISFYITIYYEMEEISSVMKYRTLRMRYDLQILPSLDVSFQLSPCPSKLQEFLVHMEVVNRTSSECFQIHQISSVGCQWEISLLQSADPILPSQSLFGGQALSCFFTLKDSKDSISSLSTVSQSDVRLGSPDENKMLYDISRSPLANFHENERSNQGSSPQGDPNTVDFILISRLPKSSIQSEDSDAPNLFSHHACHCSIAKTGPISWHVDGPRTISHDFSASFCEIKLTMIINNASKAIASVRIKTFDSPAGSTSQSNEATAVTSTNQSGWHYSQGTTDVKIASDVSETSQNDVPAVESVSPFIWSGSSSTKVQIQAVSKIEVPLRVCVFSPGIYDLSNYVLNWELQIVNGQESLAGLLSGTSQGYQYHLTVLPN